MVRKNLMFLSAVVLTSSASAYGDWTYNPSTGHWYQLTGPGLTWTQAEQAAVVLGGHLVTINDNAENDWVFAQFGTGGAQLWIGLYQVPGSPEPAGGWVWGSGEPVMYTNWRLGEPNNDGGIENVATMLGASDPTTPPAKWNDGVDSPSASLFPGIVEREVDPAVPTVSEWGLVVMTLLTLVAGTIILVRPRLARV